MSKTAMKEEVFIPDVVFDISCPFARFVTVELDGVKQERTFEARVKWESFERPVLGELVNQSEPDEAQPYTHCRGPKWNEFDYQGVWVKCIQGLVEIKVKDEDRAEFDKSLAIFKEYLSR